MTLRRLVVVLGDQLDADSAVFDDFRVHEDAIWMCEAPAEARHVWSHKARIALFLSAMRHFRDRMRDLGRRVIYRETGGHAHDTLRAALAHDLAALRPSLLVMVKAGEWRLAESLAAAAHDAGIPLRLMPDRHFLVEPDAFEDRWPARRASPRMEFFYRWMRRRTGILMDGDQPVGGRWNFDAENRRSFGNERPRPPPRLRAPADAITDEVLALVEMRYADHPGELSTFDWPVTREAALATLDRFIRERLAGFGAWQDAMWTGEAWLWHAQISPALNLKLLHPAEVCAAAEQAWRSGVAPLAAVEGFVRQILGWREYVRMIYWRRMPSMLGDNALGATAPLPSFYWTGRTDYACLSDAIAQTLRHGYAHHIQRLMVTGLFALLAGVEPRQVHEWYLAIYVDAVEWVELPNTIGMSQYADGGVLASKPYIASGRYIQRMSNACRGCRHDPAQATGPRACPFTTLYWDFLDRHERRFERHPRLGPQVRNLQRKSTSEREALREATAALRRRLLEPDPAGVSEA